MSKYASQPGNNSRSERCLHLRLYEPVQEPERVPGAGQRGRAAAAGRGGGQPAGALLAGGHGAGPRPPQRPRHGLAGGRLGPGRPPGPRRLPRGAQGEGEAVLPAQTNGPQM